MKTPAGETNSRDVPDKNLVIRRTTISVEVESERILRTLPEWFGVEESLLDYVRNTSRYPTFVAEVDNNVVAFASLIEHFPTSWEVHCIAVDAGFRGRGIGKRLHGHVESWLMSKGVLALQVKTIAATHPSRAYAETRGFYAAAGYVPVEIFPHLWVAPLPVLQMVKMLRPGNAPTRQVTVREP